MNTKALVATSIICSLVFYTNCAPISGDLDQGQQQDVDLASTAIGQTNGGGASVALKTCEFPDSDIISNILRNELNIPSGDVPVYEEDGSVVQSNDCRTANGNNDMTCYHLASKQKELGAADLANDVKADKSCSTTKYKVAAEVMIHACFAQMQDPVTKGQLFPEGESNFDEIYLRFVGRQPLQSENEILSELADSLQPENRAFGVCSVVASSIEALMVL